VSDTNATSESEISAKGKVRILRFLVIVGAVGAHRLFTLSGLTGDQAVGGGIAILVGGLFALRLFKGTKSESGRRNLSVLGGLLALIGLVVGGGVIFILLTGRDMEEIRREEALERRARLKQRAKSKAAPVKQERSPEKTESEGN
jgi:high-affinity Fe2+/Pb2+ permease